MRVRGITRGAPARRGAALLFAVVVAFLMAGLSLAFLLINTSNQRVRVHAQNDSRSFYAAESGLSDAYVQVTEGLLDLPGAQETVLVGTPETPEVLGGAQYWVEITSGGSHTWSLASTGVDGLSTTRLELVLSELPTGFFQFAAFGADGVVLDSNAFIDSYDSADGNYESQVQGGNDWAKENGDVGSNADIVMSSNTEVHGNAQPGPGGILDDSAPGVLITGSTEPLEEPFELPPIEVPSFPSSGTLIGTTDVVLGPGPVHYDQIQMKGGSRLTIQGPATLVVDDFEMKSNSQLVFDTAGGEVELIATGDFLLQSNSDTITLSESALDVTLLLAGNNVTKSPPDQLELASNSDFIGAIYAPNAEFSLASNFNVYGSIICGFLDLSSQGEIHYDESLLYDGDGGSGEYEATLWRRLPHE